MSGKCNEIGRIDSDMYFKMDLSIFGDIYFFIRLVIV